MSESSLPPFGPARRSRAFSGFEGTRRPALLRRLREALRRVPTGLRRRRGDDAEVPSKSPSPELESRAASLIREYLEAQVTNLERAERLGRKADRLEAEGTPSESARNRAERARGEVSAGLDALRNRFVGTAGEGTETGESARVFDRVAGTLYPAFEPGRPARNPQ